MKYLLLLVLCLSCQSNPKKLPKVGDCVRIYSNITVADFVIVETFRDKYVLKNVYDSGNRIIITTTKKVVFTQEELNKLSKIIDCKDVE